MSKLYGVLGVAQSADHAQIKLAFRNLAKTCHPDLHGGDRRAEQRFKEINRAYETLSNTTAKAAYDAKCAHERAMTRQRFASAATVMSASFLITVGSCLFVAILLLSV